MAGPSPRDRVLVTGATGFIGSHLVRHLVGAGVDVWALVRPGADRSRLEGAGSPTFVEADLKTGEGLDAALASASPTRVFHLAGVTWVRAAPHDWRAIREGLAVNLGGTLNLLEAIQRHAPQVVRVVRAGGLEEYGAGPTPYVEEQREDPVSPYSASQLSATQYCAMLKPYLPFEVVTLRLALVYGPHQGSDFFIPAAIGALLRGRVFEMGAGEQKRDLLYVDDAVDAFEAAAWAPRLSHGLFNVSSNVGHTMRHVGETIVRLTGASPSLLRTHVRLPRTNDIPVLIAAAGRASSGLDWRATTSLVEGLTRTVAWHREHGPASAPGP